VFTVVYVFVGEWLLQEK